MLNERAKRGIIKAYVKARELEKPYLRICADIHMHPPISQELFNAIKKVAIIDVGDAVFVIGPYENALRPITESYFQSREFIYGSLQIDGVKQNGNINVAMWFSKPELEQLKPNDFVKTFANISMAEVDTRVEDWNELFKNLEFSSYATQLELSKSAKSDKPFVLKVCYEYGSLPYEDFVGLSHPYRGMPLEIWHFYGGSPPPEELQEFYRKLRSSPSSFVRFLR